MPKASRMRARICSKGLKIFWTSPWPAYWCYWSPRSPRQWWHVIFSTPAWLERRAASVAVHGDDLSGSADWRRGADHAPLMPQYPSAEFGIYGLPELTTRIGQGAPVDRVSYQGTGKRQIVCQSESWLCRLCYPAIGRDWHDRTGGPGSCAAKPAQLTSAAFQMPSPSATNTRARRGISSTVSPSFKASSR